MEIICLRGFFCDFFFGVVTKGASVSTVLPLKNMVHRPMASISPESLLVTQNLDPQPHQAHRIRISRDLWFNNLPNDSYTHNQFKTT